MNAKNLENSVHIWYFNLDRDDRELVAFDRLLSDGERHRANKLIDPSLQKKQIAIRGAVRSILSKYIEIDPRAIEFATTANGKPYLPNSSIEFNLSHAHNLGVLAVCNGSPVGVDIEYHRKIAADRLVDRFFAPLEKSAFNDLAIVDRHPAFFHAWTQKEAYLKAIGTGLSTPLDRIIVNINPHSPPQLVNGDSRWEIYPLDRLPINYSGAIVVDRHRSSLVYAEI